MVSYTEEKNGLHLHAYNGSKKGVCLSLVVFLLSETDVFVSIIAEPPLVVTQFPLATSWFSVTLNSPQILETNPTFSRSSSISTSAFRIC